MGGSAQAKSDTEMRPCVWLETCSLETLMAGRPVSAYTEGHPGRGTSEMIGAGYGKERPCTQLLTRGPGPGAWNRQPVCLPALGKENETMARSLLPGCPGEASYVSAEQLSPRSHVGYTT